MIPESGRTLEEGMATHSSILAWRIPWTEKPGGRWSMVVAKSLCFALSPSNALVGFHLVSSVFVKKALCMVVLA